MDFNRTHLSWWGWRPARSPGSVRPGHSSSRRNAAHRSAAAESFSPREQLLVDSSFRRRRTVLNASNEFDLNRTRQSHLNHWRCVHSAKSRQTVDDEFADVWPKKQECVWLLQKKAISKRFRDEEITHMCTRFKRKTHTAWKQAWRRRFKLFARNYIGVAVKRA